MIARRTLALAALVAVLPAALGAQAAKKKPAAAPKAAPATAPAANATPTAREVIDAYVKAIGGREAVMARTNARRVATLEMPAMGMKADIEAVFMAPNRFASKMSLPGMGEFMQGFDGTTAWAIDPMQGARMLQGAEAEQLKAQADFYGELREASRYASQRVVEKADFEGRPAWKLEMVRASGDTTYDFFDVESKLLVGTQATVRTQMGAIPSTTLVQDYKTLDGILTPTKQIQRANGQEMIVTLVSVESGKVDAAALELPAQIKALLPAK